MPKMPVSGEPTDENPKIDNVFDGDYLDDFDDYEKKVLEAIEALFVAFEDKKTKKGDFDSATRTDWEWVGIGGHGVIRVDYHSPFKVGW
eukprot:1058565_1